VGRLGAGAKTKWVNTRRPPWPSLLFRPPERALLLVLSAGLDRIDDW